MKIKLPKIFPWTTIRMLEMKSMMDLNQVKGKDLRWVLGAMVSPLYSFRDAQPEALAGTSDQESGTISYAAGVQGGL